MLAKRIGALLLGALLLAAIAFNLWNASTIEPWLLLLAIPLAFGVLRALARSEGVAFGAWQDFVWGGLLSSVAAFAIGALLEKKSLPFAIGAGWPSVLWPAWH